MESSRSSPRNVSISGGHRDSKHSRASRLSSTWPRGWLQRPWLWCEIVCARCVYHVIHASVQLPVSKPRERLLEAELGSTRHSANPNHGRVVLQPMPFPDKKARELVGMPAADPHSQLDFGLATPCGVHEPLARMSPSGASGTEGLYSRISPSNRITSVRSVTQQTTELLDWWHLPPGGVQGKPIDPRSVSGCGSSTKKTGAFRLGGYWTACLLDSRVALTIAPFS